MKTYFYLYDNLLYSFFANIIGVSDNVSLCLSCQATTFLYDVMWHIQRGEKWRICLCLTACNAMQIFSVLYKIVYVQ